ncbi:hypothetical protein [Pedosphaera parvula]|uniref:Uncharacterized protein n=1 Tax=Pedosphaera parvula (strain Ellin514) TaxID=320771 RepID=B9XMR7_PEDPL|nr:hypothetical protein [Pedosphaera parvula]EEF58842.1 hypothetical protein Cflav_PD1675 [Pedosphaera parvula Ellin514]
MIQRTRDISNGLQPSRGDRGAPIIGPRNVPLERENPGLLASPDTEMDIRRPVARRVRHRGTDQQDPLQANARRRQ